MDTACTLCRAAFVITTIWTITTTAVEAFRLDITPQYSLIDESEQNVVIECNADTSLSICQFRWQQRTGNQTRMGPIIDFSHLLSRQEVLSEIELQRKYGVKEYRYIGGNLENGNCGLSLTVTNVKSWVVWCRVRATHGSWKYNWTELIANNWLSDFGVTMEEREVHASTNSEDNLRNILCRTHGSISTCNWTPAGGEMITFKRQTNLNESIGRYKYYGKGLEQQECGLTISEISPVDNGFSECFMRTPHGAASRVALLTVARSFSFPILNLTYNETMFLANCTVPDGSPVAKLKWLLNDKVLRDEDGDESILDVNEPWRWPWEDQPVTQVLRGQLSLQDHGKTLHCEARHRYLTDEVRVSSATISITHLLNTCPPPTTQNVVMDCSFEGHPINCSQPVVPGVKGRFSCKPGFFNPDSTKFYNSVTCLDTGMWNPPIYTCIPECGRRNTNEGEPQIAGGKVVNRVEEFPWHVAVYELSENLSHILICGGSLITPKVVISAAHCFWSESDGRKKNSSLYEVVSGKLKRAWLDEDDPSHVQRRKVKSIVIPTRYHGRTNNFHCDIALVHLTDEMEINVNVNLVCIDWENRWERIQLKEGKKGTVAGWGFTEQGSLSDRLRQVELPFIEHEICYNSLSSQQRPIYTADKICAGYINRSISVCKGDSGGGLVFRHDSFDRYYLRGLVSTNFKPTGSSDICYSQHYTSFTLVSEYRQWIQDNV